MNADPKTATCQAELTCPYCDFRWKGRKARKSNQCPRCHRTIWHELKHRSILEWR
jgi:hypothetical protein